MAFGGSKETMIDPAKALVGRDERPFMLPQTHRVLGTDLLGPWPDEASLLYVGMGCFWGAERIFWKLPGVICTAVGYQGGYTPNPLYEEVCTGRTGHAEVVMIVHSPELPLTQLLTRFWEEHDPTQGMRQGNDRGTQYRSAFYWTTPEQGQAYADSARDYAAQLALYGFPAITTDARPAEEAGPFYYAEAYHQQYLDRVPQGYCGLAGTGVHCPTG